MSTAQGELSAALSNAIVALLAEYTGRGATQSRTYVHENLIVCVLHDSMTKGERSLVRDGKEEAVLTIRRTYQETMRPELIEIVERLTGRKVSAFLSPTMSTPTSRSSHSCSSLSTPRHSTNPRP